MRRLTPCGRTRREFIWEAGGGFTGLALASMLANDGFFAAAGTPPHDNPLSPKKPHAPAKAKSLIVLFMYGGPSQMETWDPKPELNRLSGQPMPDSIGDPLVKQRNPGKLLGSKRKFAPAGKSGIAVSDLFPHQAKCVDDLAIVRGMYADSFAHGSGLLQMNCGFLRQGYPSLGSWVTYGLGTVNQDLPAYVVMLDRRGGPINGPPNWGSGFMPAVFQGTTFRTTGDPILNLRPAGVGQESPEVVKARQEAQIKLLRDLDAQRHAELPERGELAARIASYELAFRMQSEAPSTVDLSKESAATIKLYGMDDPATEPFGRRLLIARRLIERGVRVVQVYSGGGHLDDNWDAHGDVEKNHLLHGREIDKPIAGLLTDLKARGLLDSTLVVWTGEFGRTPTGQNGPGRDHNPRGFSAWLAGGGVKGGQTIGATDPFGSAAVENKVHVHDLHATLLHLLGLDHKLLTYFHAGREYRLTDVHGRIVQELAG